MDIISSVSSLGLQLGRCVVIGSCTLAIRNMRSARDIDLIVTQDIYDEFKTAGWRERYFAGSERTHTLFKEPIDMGTSWSVTRPGGSYCPTLELLAANADVIEGIPFANLRDVLQWKRACQRDKDIADVRLIEQYLNSNTRS